MVKPAVSIIIPAYNSSATIVETLASIPPALSVSYEVIVVDDGSQDDTAAVIEGAGLPHVRVVRQANAGVSSARNAGIAQAVGDYIVCLDADDRLCPQAVDRLMAALMAQPEAVLAYGNYVTINATGERTGKRGMLNKVAARPSGDCLIPMLRANFIVNPGAVLIRRALMGGNTFNTALRYGEDAEFWCRLALCGDFVHLDGEPVLEYRRHDASVSATADITAGAEDRLRLVFGNPALKQRLSADVLRGLYAARRAHILILQAVREARAGRWRAGLQAYGRSVWACPRRFVSLTLRFILQGLKLA